MYLRDVGIAMGTDGAASKNGKIDGPYLIQIAPSTAGDEANGSEALVSAAHNFTEGSCDWGIVYVLEDDDGGTVEFSEALNLISHAAINIIATRRSIGTEGGGSGIAHNGGHFGEGGGDTAVHISAIPWPHLKQLNDIADCGRIEGGELVQNFRFEHNWYPLLEFVTIT
jgi:hypothetical protein